MASPTQRVNELPHGTFQSTDLSFIVNMDGTSELVDLYTPIMDAVTKANEALVLANTALTQIADLDARLTEIETTAPSGFKMFVNEYPPTPGLEGDMWFNSVEGTGGSMWIALHEVPYDLDSELIWVQANI